MRYPKTIKMDPNRVEVAPFGAKLCQNVATRLRIMLDRSLDPKTKFKHLETNQDFPQGRRHGAEPPKFDFPVFSIEVPKKTAMMSCNRDSPSEYCTPLHKKLMVDR